MADTAEYPPPVQTPLQHPQSIFSGLPQYPPNTSPSSTYTFSSASIRPLYPQQPMYMPAPAAFQPRVAYGYLPQAMVGPPPPMTQRLPEERGYSQPPPILPRTMEPAKISPPFSSSSQQLAVPSRPSSASPYARPTHIRGSSLEGLQQIDRSQWPYPQSPFQAPPPRPQQQHDPTSELLLEKRRRNAGASARFRDRRKQREQETLARCRQLQKELDDLRNETGYNAAVQEGISQWKSRFDEMEAENHMLKNLLTRNNIPFEESRQRNRSLSFRTQSTSEDDAPTPTID